MRQLFLLTLSLWVLLLGSAPHAFAQDESTSTDQTTKECDPYKQENGSWVLNVDENDNLVGEECQPCNKRTPNERCHLKLTDDTGTLKGDPTELINFFRQKLPAGQCVNVFYTATDDSQPPIPIPPIRNLETLERWPCFCAESPDGRIKWWSTVETTDYVIDPDQLAVVQAQGLDSAAERYEISKLPRIPTTQYYAQEVRYCIPLEESLGDLSAVTGTTGVDLLSSYVTVAFRYGASLIGIVCVLVIVISGVQMSIAGFDQNQYEQGKTRIIQALASMALLFLSGALLRTINPSFFVVDKDTDGDGLTDAIEQEYGFNLNDPSDGFAADADGDTFSNYHEAINGLHPRVPNPDNDANGLPDEWEVFMELVDGTGRPYRPPINYATMDPDNDGQTNLQEFYAGRDPLFPEAVGTIDSAATSTEE